MSYMRGEFYVYPTEGGLVIQHAGGSVLLPDEIAVDLAAMIWHRQTPGEQQAVLERVAQRYGGNFGADGVMAVLGRPSAMDGVGEQIRKLQGAQLLAEHEAEHGEITEAEVDAVGQELDG